MQMNIISKIFTNFAHKIIQNSEGNEKFENIQQDFRIYSIKFFNDSFLQ